MYLIYTSLHQHVNPFCERKTHMVPTNVRFSHLPKLESIRSGLVDFFKSQVHEVVAKDHVPVEGFAVLELDQLHTRVSALQRGGLEGRRAIGLFCAACNKASGNCQIGPFASAAGCAELKRRQTILPEGLREFWRT